MTWIERGRDKLTAMGKNAQPKVEQLREGAAPRVQAAKESAERAGATARTRLDDIAKAFREGASGDDEHDTTARHSAGPPTSVPRPSTPTTD